MKKSRAEVGFTLVQAEAAVAAFVKRITVDDSSIRGRLYSVGLTADLIYSLKIGRQRVLAGAKLIAALAACPELEIVIEAQAERDSASRRWIVRAEVERAASVAPPPSGYSLPNSYSSNRGGALNDRPVPAEPGARHAIQLSLFTSLACSEDVELEMRDVRLTRKESRRADVRVDFIVRDRQAS
jgi:hypothetical protein